MINIRCAVKKGSITNQDGQFSISELLVRGNQEVTINARSQRGGEELTASLSLDQPSFLDLCKNALIAAGVLPKWFYIGVVIDANRGQLRTYFNPHKDKFFADLYLDLQDHLPEKRSEENVELIVKDFFDQHMEFRFHYLMIPLDSLLTGSGGGKVEQTDLRL